MTRKQKFQLYLTEKKYQALQKAANEKQVTMSEVSRFAIGKELAKYLDCTTYVGDLGTHILVGFLL